MRLARRPLLVAALAALVVAGCASTRLTSTWQDPALKDATFHKVLVVFQNADAELRDVDRVKARVRELGFDSSVVIRVVGVERQQTYVPPEVYAVPAPYRGF